MGIIILILAYYYVRTHVYRDVKRLERQLTRDRNNMTIPGS